MKRLKNVIMLVDCLCNFSPTSGASDDYNRGLVIGMVSGLMATGMSFDEALEQTAKACPNTYISRLDLLPESWREDWNIYTSGK